MNYRGVFNTNKTYNQYETSYAYTKKQTSVLNTCMLTAGIGFTAIFLIGKLCQYLLGNISYYDATMLQTVSSIGIIVGFVLSLIWCFRVHKASTLFALIVVSIYCISYGIGFGFLFVVLENQDIMFAFLMVGAIFILTFFISKAISFKTGMKLTKIIIVTSIVSLIAFALSWIISIFAPSLIFNKTTFLITSGLSAVFSVLYLTWSLWQAQNMDNFIQDGDISKKIGLFFGFQILMNLVQLVLVILRLLLIFGNRR